MAGQNRGALMMAAREIYFLIAGFVAGWAAASIVVCIRVIPMFESVFANFGVSLPRPMMTLIAVSHAVVRWWWLLLFLLCGTIALLSRMVPTRG
jgi:type II secretory pathway component PulF